MNQTETARYIMIGGFLGAGKSTSITRLAQRLDAQGIRVGLITNDQGHGLVDTVNLKAHGFPVEEIPGGCFCCRFNSLVEAADNLSRQVRPDVFIAEPVGSCTDLVASVSYPLRRIYGERFSIAPLSVVVDPRRALVILGLRAGKTFSEKVIYIYLKQLEEASIIVINKTDLLEEIALADLKKALAARFPQAEIHSCSARSGLGLETWFDAVLAGNESSETAMSVDYQIYAAGEALLGWLNATVELKSEILIDGNRLLEDLARRVQSRLVREGVEIAHFKMTLSPADGSGELGALNLVGGDFRPELAQDLSDDLDRGQLIVNLRAEGSPEQLTAALKDALTLCQSPTTDLVIEHLEAFKPSEPQPVYRMASPTEDPVLSK